MSGLPYGFYSFDEFINGWNNNYFHQHPGDQTSYQQYFDQSSSNATFHHVSQQQNWYNNNINICQNQDQNYYGQSGILQQPNLYNHANIQQEPNLSILNPQNIFSPPRDLNQSNIQQDSELTASAITTGSILNFIPHHPLQLIDDATIGAIIMDLGNYKPNFDTILNMDEKR